MWGGRNTLQPHPSDTREMSRSVTGTGLLDPLMLQIEIFRQPPTFRLNL